MKSLLSNVALGIIGIMQIPLPEPELKQNEAFQIALLHDCSRLGLDEIEREQLLRWREKQASDTATR